jgi:hypothetical protein
MIITLQLSNLKVIVESDDCVTAHDALSLFKSAMLALGYHPDTLDALLEVEADGEVSRND